VVAPRRLREVDDLAVCVGIMTSNESTTNAESASTRDGLRDGNPALVQRRAVFPVGQTCSKLVEFRLASDRSIFLVDLVGNEDTLSLPNPSASFQTRQKASFTHFLHGGQNIRLPVLIAVRTDTKVDLIGRGISLESLSNTWNPVNNEALLNFACFEHIPRIGSGGPAGTLAHTERERAAERRAMGRAAASMLLKTVEGIKEGI